MTARHKRETRSCRATCNQGFQGSASVTDNQLGPHEDALPLNGAIEAEQDVIISVQIAGMCRTGQGIHGFIYLQRTVDFCRSHELPVLIVNERYKGEGKLAVPYLVPLSLTCAEDDGPNRRSERHYESTRCYQGAIVGECKKRLERRHAWRGQREDPRTGQDFHLSVHADFIRIDAGVIIRSGACSCWNCHERGND